MSKFNQESVSFLVWLKELDAIDKNFKEKDLLHLKRLDLSNRKLEVLHDDIGTLEELTYLNLSNNKLHVLPKSFDNLTTLISLNLRRNQLKELPESIGDFSLRSLNISGNKLEDISMLCRCTQLRTVDISGNFLHVLSRVFDQAIHLRSINASSNLLNYCAFTLDSLNELEILNLSDNRLEKLPVCIEELDSLLHLNLSNNFLDDDLSILEALELETINISSNNIHNLNLKGMVELLSLAMDNNEIQKATIDKGFAPKLKSFSAEGCALKRFIILPSKNIEYLSFSDNNIQTVPSAILNYPNLGELDIDDNQLIELCENFKKIKSLNSLYINGNPLNEKSKLAIKDMEIEYCDIFVKKDIIVRKAQLNDLRQMSRLLAQLFANESDFHYDYKKHYDALKLMYEKNRADLLVAKYRNRVIGMVTLQELISSAEGGISGQLEDLIVDNEFRKMGVGTRLVRTVFDMARDRSYVRIQLAADKSNHKALYFYRQRGFNLSNLNLYHYTGIEL